MLGVFPFFMIVVFMYKVVYANEDRENTSASSYKSCHSCQMVGFLGSNGVPGVPGNPGFPGRDGPKGEKGSPGKRGAQGVAGIPGKLGPRGFEGPKGQMGEKGVNGTGIPGNIGPRGYKGSKGKRGPVGPKGQMGEKGVNGTGITGNIGPRGPKGFKGERGISGTKGQKGDATNIDPRQLANWKQCTWQSRTNTNSGKIKECSFNKLHQNTALKVSFRGNIQIYNSNGKCNRWYFKFNGNECSGPLPVDSVFYIRYNSVTNILLPHFFEGFCENLPQGTVRVELWVGKCSGEGLGDAYTGWKSVSRIMIEEVPPSQ